MTSTSAGRENAKRAFDEWLRIEPSHELSFGELLRWLDDGLELARRSGRFLEVPVEEKAERIAVMKQALAVISSPR